MGRRPAALGRCRMQWWLRCSKFNSEVGRWRINLRDQRTPEAGQRDPAGPGRSRQPGLDPRPPGAWRDPRRRVTVSPPGRDREGVAHSPIELRSLDLVEVAHGRRIKIALSKGEDVVATDDARLRQPLLRANLDLGADAAYGPRDRCARHRAEHGDGGIAGQDADGTPPAGGPRSAQYTSPRATTRARSEKPGGGRRQQAPGPGAGACRQPAAGRRQRPTTRPRVQRPRPDEATPTC